MPLKIHTLASLDEYLRFAVGAQPTDPRGAVVYLFRGQADAAWKLQPTLHRAASRDGRAPLPSDATLLEIEKRAVERFRRDAAIHVPVVILDHVKRSHDWWTLMQHHGAPTRLLDWTASIHVAAYFAVRSLHSHDGALYVLHVGSLNARMKELHPKIDHSAEALLRLMSQPGQPDIFWLFGRSIANSDRMSAQQGAFMTCVNVAGDFEERIGDAIENPSDDVQFYKLIIPRDLKPSLFRLLMTMNIGAHSLFPGADGLGTAIAEEIRSSEY